MVIKSALDKPTLLEMLKSLLNWNFAILILVQILNSFANTIVNIPVNKFGAALGASATVLGLVATLYSIMQTATRPFSGVVLDKMDVRKWLFICLGLRVISFVSYALTGSIAMFVISRMLHGISFSLVGTALPCVAGMAMNNRALGTAFGIYLTIPKIITSFAPIVSLYIYEKHGPSAAFFTASILIIIAMLFLSLLRLPKIPISAYAIEIKKKKYFNMKSISSLICWSAVPASLVQLFIGMTNNAIIMFLVVYGDIKGISNIALFFTVSGFVSIFSRMSGGILSDRLGSDFLIICLIFMFITPVLISFANSIVIFVIAAVAYQLGHGCAYPAAMLLAINSARKDQRGIAISTLYLFLDFSGIITGILAGYLAHTFGYEAMFLTFSIFPLMGIIVYMLFRKRIQTNLNTIGVSTAPSPFSTVNNGF